MAFDCSRHGLGDEEIYNSEYNEWLKNKSSDHNDRIRSRDKDYSDWFMEDEEATKCALEAIEKITVI